MKSFVLKSQNECNPISFTALFRATSYEPRIFWLVFKICPFRISAGTPPILTASFSDFLRARSKCSYYYVTISRDWSLLYSFLFTIYQKSYHWTLHCLSHSNMIKKKNTITLNTRRAILLLFSVFLVFDLIFW